MFFAAYMHNISINTTLHAIQCNLWQRNLFKFGDPKVISQKFHATILHSPRLKDAVQYYTVRGNKLVYPHIGDVWTGNGVLKYFHPFEPKEGLKQTIFSGKTLPSSIPLITGLPQIETDLI